MRYAINIIEILFTFFFMLPLQLNSANRKISYNHSQTPGILFGGMDVTESPLFMELP